jgi:hypothetical protein
MVVEDEGPAVTVAKPVLLLAQVPPATGCVNVTVWPTHTLDVVPGPEIFANAAVTVITAVTLQLPTLYDIVVVPPDTPVTKPVNEPTVALPVTEDVHKPPDVVLANCVVDPAQTVSVPVIGSGPVVTFTVVND